MKACISSGVSALTLATAVGLLAVPAFAQSAAPGAQEPPAQTTSVDDIVVTAQRRSESINDVPLSIQAFSGETLTQAGITDPSGLSQITSGLNFSKSSASTPVYTLRGIGFNTPNLSSTSPVGLYFDEVAYAYPYMASGPTFDLQRVEVLKGPQGTLYGRNTTGGLVNFITAKPGDVFEASAKAEIGNYETFNFEGYVSGPLSDTVGLRLSGRSESSGEGWQKSVSRDDTLGEKDRLGLRALLAINPNDRLSIDLSASYWRDRSDTVASQAVAFTPDSAPFAAPGVAGSIRSDWGKGGADWDPAQPGRKPFQMDSRFYGLAATVNYDLSDSLSIVSLTGYNDVRRDDFNDVDGTPVGVFAYESIGRIKSFSQELRLVGSGDRLNYTVGGYYSKDDIQDDQIGDFDASSVLRQLRFVANLVDPTNSRYTAEQKATGFRFFRTTTEQESRTWSVFANGDYQLTDTLKLSGGLRYTQDQLKFSACSRDIDGLTIPVWNTAVPFVIKSRTGIDAPGNVGVNECLTYKSDFTGVASYDKPTLDEDNVAARVALNYEPNPDVLIYGSISRGFKSGAVPIIAGNVETQFAPATQEQVTAFEAGAKLKLAGGQAQLNFAGFFMSYKDKQLFGEILDPVFTSLTRIVNIPESEIYGGEVELTLRPTDALSFNGSAAYTHTEVTDYQGFNRAGLAEDFAGGRFPYTPEWQVNGSVNYDAPINGALGFQANLNASYQSETSSSLSNEPGFEVDAYTLVNLTASIYTLDGAWKVGIFARNLLDENYWTATDVLTDTVFRVPGMTRTYGVALTRTF